jgi:predicted ATP-grasp superfamily ATP-dependent carboligase
MRERTSPNPERAEPGWPAVVVAGGYQTGVVLMRNLERRGLRVYCVEWLRQQPCFRSVYGTSFKCPNPDERPDDWLEFMIGVSEKIGGRPVLIPSADQFVTAMARHAVQLEPHFRFCQDAAAVQGLMATKQRQYDLASDHGLPVPLTRFVSSAADLADFASAARFPCLFKPLHAREWARLPEGHPFRGRQLVLAATGEELSEKYRSVADLNPQVVMQEVIEGPDTAKLVYLSCYGRDGRRLGACIVRQLRTAPIYFGSASVVEPVADPEADQLCDGFLRGVGYAGICELEIKRDTRDGRIKLIEANPRYSVTADAAPYAGVEIGWLHYLDLIGQPVAFVTHDGRDFRHIVLLRDFSTFRSYRRAGLLTWWGFLRSYRPPVGFFDFDLRDWRVTAANVDQLLRLLIGPPIRRIFPKRKR